MNFSLKWEAFPHFSLMNVQTYDKTDSYWTKLQLQIQEIPGESEVLKERAI